MQCEICGRFVEFGYKIKVEGSIVSACGNCKSSGEEIISEIGVKRDKMKDENFQDFSDNNNKFFSLPLEKPRYFSKGSRPSEVAYTKELEEDTLKLVSDYSEMIRKAREKKNLTQEKFALWINQPKSLVHRMELGRYEPNIKLAKKIEKKLDIKIIEEIELNEEVIENMKKESREKSSFGRGRGDLTLGDIIVVKKREK